MNWSYCLSLNIWSATFSSYHFRLCRWSIPSVQLPMYVLPCFTLFFLGWFPVAHVSDSFPTWKPRHLPFMLFIFDCFTTRRTDILASFPAWVAATWSHNAAFLFLFETAFHLLPVFKRVHVLQLSSCSIVKVHCFCTSFNFLTCCLQFTRKQANLLDSLCRCLLPYLPTRPLVDFLQC